MIKLTARQKEILLLIEKNIERTGFPPTRAEIATTLGFKSVNASEEHLQALRRKGMIEMVPGIARGIRLLQSVMDESDKDAKTNAYDLPLVGRVAAGSPILATEYVEKQFHIDATMFAEKPDFLLKVNGLSMRDAGILEGDLIAVKKTNKARNGEIVVARLGDDVTVKRFKKTSINIELIAENPDFKPIIVDSQTIDFEIAGKVVGVIRTMQ